MTDAELVLRARGGDQIAAQQLVHRHRGLAKMHALDFFAPGLERDDLIAEGLLGLAKAIRAATRQKHKPLNHAASLEAPLKGEDGDGGLGDLLPSTARSPLELLLAEEERLKLLAGFASLTLMEDRAIQGIADGTPYEDIADRLGVDCKVVDNAAQRARRKLAIALDLEMAAA